MSAFLNAAWALAVGLDWLWLYLLALAAACVIVTLLTSGGITLLARLDDRQRRRRPRGVLDEKTELWLFPDPAFRDATAYLRTEDDVVFAASVLADIDDLPEVPA